MSTNSDELSINTETIAETEHFSVWHAQEPDGETTYHIEFGSVTLHFFDEEWQEALDLFRTLLN